MTLYQQPPHSASDIAGHLDRWLCSCDTLEQLLTCENLAEKWLENKKNGQQELEMFIKKAQVQRILINLLNEEL